MLSNKGAIDLNFTIISRNFVKLREYFLKLFILIWKWFNTSKAYQQFSFYWIKKKPYQEKSHFCELWFKRQMRWKIMKHSSKKRVQVASTTPLREQTPALAPVLKGGHNVFKSFKFFDLLLILIKLSINTLKDKKSKLFFKRQDLL